MPNKTIQGVPALDMTVLVILSTPNGIYNARSGEVVLQTSWLRLTVAKLQSPA